MAFRATASRQSLLKHASPFNVILQSRCSSGGSGRVLSDEERAAENMYIKKMEKEKLEKLATKGVKPEETISSSSGSVSPALSHPPLKDTSTDPNKNVAVAAGVVALVASSWWFYRANKKIVIEEEID